MLTPERLADLRRICEHPGQCSHSLLTAHEGNELLDHIQAQNDTIRTINSKLAEAREIWPHILAPLGAEDVNLLDDYQDITSLDPDYYLIGKTLKEMDAALKENDATTVEG